MRALGEQRLEGVEELLLRALLAGEELDVVDQQQVERVVLRLQLVEGLALVVLHHVGDELLGVQVEDARVGPVGEERVADGVDQVRLAEADAAVDEERVVHEAGRAGDVQRGGARHLVGAAGNQRVEGQRRIEPAARRQRGARPACATPLATAPPLPALAPAWPFAPVAERPRRAAAAST